MRMTYPIFNLYTVGTTIVLHLALLYIYLHIYLIFQDISCYNYSLIVSFT